MNPYYESEGVTIYHGDSWDIVPSLEESFDLVVTSPQYNLGTMPGRPFGHWKNGQPHGGNSKWSGVGPGGIGYDAACDNLPTAEYESRQRQMLSKLWERLTHNGAIFYNHKPRVNAETLWTPLRCNPGLPVRQVVIWDRGSSPNFTPTAFAPVCEWVVIYARPAWRLASRGASGVGDVWRFPPERNNPHPAPFPLELPTRAIECCSPANVLDPFAGSGTTLIAAVRSGVRAVGIDSSERYCEMAAERLRDAA